MKFGLVKKSSSFIAVFIVAFCIGFTTNNYISNKPALEETTVQQPPQNFVPLNRNIEVNPYEKINVVGKGGATCTTGNKYTMVINADKEPGEELRYKVICGLYDSGWVATNTITVTKLWKPGAYTATVKVSNKPDNPNSGKIRETNYTFFKL